MTVPSTPPRNAFERVMRRVYNPLGFSKGYNFTLWFIFGGAMLGLCLNSLLDFSLDGIYCPKAVVHAKGEASTCYWIKNSMLYRVGFGMHIMTMVPAAMLAVFQFVPIIRYKALLYHRIAGWVIAVLIVVSHTGAIIIAQETMGGDIGSRTTLGILVVATTITFSLAIYNVKRLQLDQHRAWMLRTWFYFGFTVTFRMFSALLAAVITVWPSQQQHVRMTCKEINFILDGNQTKLYEDYPACIPGNDQFLESGYTLVRTTNNNFVGQSAALQSVFCASLLLAFALHAAGVEIYLHMTPREAERLRQVSYERQLERGLKHPGSAGLVSSRMGDSEPWTPKTSGQTAVLRKVTQVAEKNVSDSASTSS